MLSWFRKLVKKQPEADNDFSLPAKEKKEAFTGRLLLSANKCPYCLDGDFSFEPTLACPGCHAYQHISCLAENYNDFLPHLKVGVSHLEPRT